MGVWNPTFELLVGFTPFSASCVDHDSEAVQSDGQSGMLSVHKGRAADEEAAQAQEADDNSCGEGEEEAPIFAIIRNHSLGAVHVPSLKVSSEAESLINAFLNPVPQERPEARTALSHPWMTMAPLCREYSVHR